MGRLDGRTAVIVGAGRGLGRAAAVALGREGARLVLAARTRSELEETARLAGGGEVVVADATREDDVARLARQAGETDLLVNCAGEAMLKPLTETTWADWQRIMAANLGTVFLTMREFLPRMMDRGRGCIINVASRAGIWGSPLPSVYGAAKAGVVHFTRAWARVARTRGVQLVAIAPGPMDTPMRWAATPDFDREKVLAPERVAELILYVATHPDVMFDDVLVPASIHLD